MQARTLIVACAAGVLAASSGCGAAAQALPFDGNGWDLSGPAIRIARGERGDELVVENGIARRRDVSMQDGTLEFDVQLTQRRSFVQIGFRARDDNEFEEVYLRSHKWSLPDALQYAPVRQGMSAWQLYHGPGRTAAWAFEYGGWTHVRLVARGSQAALFIGDMTTPALLVDRLAREPRPGFISLKGFVPDGTPGTDPAARFANVRIAPNEVSYTFPPAAAPATPDGLLVEQWAVSRALPPDTLREAVLPEAAVTGALTPVRANAEGLVELHQWRPLPDGTRAGAAVAQVTVSSPSARTAAFDLGFSDVATVFVNGTPIFRGDASYSYDLPRRDGLIGFDQARLYLPLRAGENVITVTITDGFGGWGLMGRFLDRAGLTIAAR